MSDKGERTVALTFGRWGGVYATGNRKCWRVCLGPLALTVYRGEFTEAVRAWLDAEARS